jgi:DNA-binding IclR family transcriptional regulator
MVPLDSVDADQPIRLVSNIGESLPLHCTAVGKAHLAFEPEDELKSRLADGLKKYTGKTITERPALLQQLHGVVENGYAVDTGEYVEDVRSIAVPIRDYTGRVVGTLAVSGPAYRMSAERIQREMAPSVVKAGRELSSRLGYEG